MITFKRTTQNKKVKLVGRGQGSGRGKTSGRGTKGQKARAGHSIRPEIRDMIKKYPKLRGRGKNSFKAFRATPAIVNVLVLLFLIFPKVSPTMLPSLIKPFFKTSIAPLKSPVNIFFTNPKTVEIKVSVSIKINT